MILCAKLGRKWNIEGLRKGWELSKLNKKQSNNCICDACGKNFHRRGSRKLRCSFSTCSKECKNKHQGKFKYKSKPRTGKEIECKVCGKKRYFSPTSIQKYCSSECYFNDENSNRQKGETHYKYTGQAKYHRHKDLKLRRWQRLLRKRDGRVCKSCKDTRGVMCADHILPWSCFPRFRYELNNGQILCKNCHYLKTREENKNRDRKGKLLPKYKEMLWQKQFPQLCGLTIDFTK